MVDDTGVGQRHSALASESRRAVLQLLVESDVPLDAAAIAPRIDLHITTVRFHLEQLENAGLIRREIARAGQRGRPRVLFAATASARETDGHRQLAEVLATALAGDPDGGRARAIEAGRRWADSTAALLVQRPTSAPRSAGSAPSGLPADADVGAVVPLVRLLDRLGFGPRVADGAERTIDLLACPFRDTAASHPDVVCSVHLGLIQRTLGTFGRDGDAVQLLPFVEPELCVIRGASIQ